MTSKAEARRLEVLRRIRDVSGDRLYESMSESRSVAKELAVLYAAGLIEHNPNGDSDQTWRRTTAGDERLASV